MKQEAFAAFYQPQEVFVSGVTPESRESSRTGAVAAEAVRGRHLATLRRLWREPRTLNEIADLSGLPITSVCSLKASMEADLEWHSYEHIAGTATRKATKRSRWKLRG